MDTKGLRRHKRPKKIKSGSKKGNADVLVVPPDILKKLGISIGNASAVQQFPNTAAQSTETIKHDATASNEMSNFGKISSELSILETANLMKKSVFLSPTFVPTIDHVISGEVEISNNENNIDPVLEGSEVKNVSYETTPVHEPYQKNGKYNMNGEFNLVNGFFSKMSDLNGDSTQECAIPIRQARENISVDSINNKQVAQNDCMKELSAQKGGTFKKTPIKSDLIVNGVIKSDPKKIDMELSSNNLKGCAIVIKQAEDKININSLQVCEIQMEQQSDPNFVEETLTPFENSVSEDNPVYLEDNNIQIEQAANNLISLDGNTIQIAQVKNAIEIEESEHNIISLEGNVYEYGQDINNIISLERSTTQIRETENDLISILGNTIQIEQPGHNLISLGGRQIEIVQADNNIMTLEVIEPDSTENNVISSEINAIVINEAQVNTLEGISFQIDDNKNISLENNMPQNICKDLSNGHANNEFGIDVVSDLTKMGISTSHPKVNADISQISKQETVVHIEETAVKNTYSAILVDDSNKAEITNEYSLCAETNPKTVAPVNKKVHKVNIISEEIITPCHHKGLSRSLSPVARALTPVLLNTIIGPKKNTDKNCSGISGSNQNSSASTNAQKTGRMIRSISTSPSEEVNSACDRNHLCRTSPINDNCGVTENILEEFSEKKSHNHAITVNGDLKNNNDIFVNTVDKATTNNSGDLKDSNSNKEFAQLSDTCVAEQGSDKNGEKECNGKKDNNVLHSDEALHQDKGEGSRNNDFDKKCSSAEESNYKKGKLKTNHEFKAVKNQMNDRTKKVDRKKKKKKITEDKNISEINVNEDEAFCDDHLTSILKSSKENNNTNTHLDKVKEIADYIKKFAHIYKDKNKVINKGGNKAADNKKEMINSKSNMIQSKLCIQGVEKPGGKKGEEGIDEIKALKTYTRQKRLREPCTTMNISNISETFACKIVDVYDTELNSINISNSYKKQDFCLCYDFGQLGSCDFDNEYEHIHFWLHDNTSDLETILSIYNDDEIGLGDRTELDEENIPEVVEDKAETNNICWNYFQKDDKEVEIINQIPGMDYCVKGNSDKNSDSAVQVLNQAHVMDDDTREHNPGTIIKDVEIETDNRIITSIDVDSQLKGEIDTIAEMKDKQKKNQHCQAVEVETTTATGTIHNKEENVNDNNSKTANNEQGTSEGNTMNSPKDKEALNKTKFKQNNRKRSVSRRQSQEASNVSSGPSCKRNVKCGVCDQLLSEAEWEHHVTKKHYHIAWKAGNHINLNDPALLEKLHQRLQSVGSLKCSICNMQTKKFNKYMNHIKNCIRQKDPTSRRASTSKDLVTCGVCQRNVQFLSWNEHIGKEHNYLAWTNDQTALNIDDENEVSKHLQNIIRVNGSLVCYKCGLNRKRVKLYLSHIETCDGTEAHIDTTEGLNSTGNTSDNEPVLERKVVKCGVCKLEVPLLQWIEHVGREHNYLAWEDGSTPLNVNDEEAVRNHLQQFIRHNDGLLCYKCGLNRKRVKMYLSHIKTCDGEGVNLDESEMNSEDVSVEPESTEVKKYECGVCNATVSLVEWNEHIGRDHNYLAWKVGSTPLDVDDEDAVKEHLLNIIRTSDGLMCYKCGLNRRRVKTYLSHIQTCDGSENQLDESTSSVNINSTIDSRRSEGITTDDPENIVTCGVCEQDVASEMWIDHIGKEHQYQAWQKDQEPWDLENEESVKICLLNISRQCDGLICNQCGIIKKYPKSFLTHIKDCTGPSALDSSKLRNEPEISSFDITDVKTKTVMCGVCNNEIKTSEWMTHLESDHSYLAWLADRPPLDLNDQAVVQRHLIEVSRITGGLKCKKCGLIRKYAKSYMHHIEDCNSDESSTRLSAALGGKDPVECAVCSEKVEPRHWRSHAMKKHYNVAWIVGTTPIEINNPYGVEPYIKEYLHKYHKLVCKICGISRVSAVGFYAHIITCGKSEEEQEIYKSVCEICKNKYLRIYKSQHMTMHREQEYAVERKQFIAKEKEFKKVETDKVEIVDGRRKAAEKAKTVIQKYTRNIGGDGVHCPKCGFASEIESEMSDHVCVEKKLSGSDSDESVDLDHSSEEDDDTDIDSNISDEEREARDQEQTKSKKHGENSACKIQRLPYQIKNLNSYMRKSAEDFVSLHLTSEDLFPQWHTFEYEVVSEPNITQYMPPLEESCKVRYADTDDWITYKRFEAKKSNDIMTMFMGACIQGIYWVPPYIGEQSGPHHEYLSILTHLASDIPKLYWHEKPKSTPALVQIWDCGNLVSGVPEFVMGLALDCGVIWAVDWCPSGARDVMGSEEDTSKVHRLGLFAAASANGSAYVFAVPYPSEIKEKGQRFYKLKPLVEMRLAMKTNRKVYQATAINWTKQRGHTHIVVGYSDGTTANFDLTNESPLLKCTENNVTILYPYHDEHSQSMCVEDVDVFPTVERAAGPGVVVAGSVGGVGAGAGRGAGSASGTLHSHAAAARVLFPPHWPGALLAGDDNLVSQAINELEWYGAGRRVGGMRACCGCAWCGRVVAAAAPALRLMRTHPAYSDFHRQIIAFAQMVPFGNKRKRKNDELSMIMEPLTYDDAIAKYGLEFKHITAKDKNTQQKLSAIPRETFPERFPLSDVTSMAFCPTAKNHHKLAVATHAGLVFIINV